MKKDSKCFWEILHGVWLQSKKTYHMHFFGIPHLAIARIAVESIHSHQFYRPTLPTKVRGPRDKEDKEEETQQCQYLSSPWITDKAPTKQMVSPPKNVRPKNESNIKLNQYDLWRTPFSPFIAAPPGTTQPVFQDVSKQKETYVKRRLSACWSTAMIIAMRMSVGPKPSSCKTSTIRISWKWNDQCANHQAVSLISTWKMVILGNITGRHFIILPYCQPWSQSPVHLIKGWTPPK